jgi:hypothetical protein
VLPLHLILAALLGWLERKQRDVIEFLREENRVLKAQLRAGGEPSPSSWRIPVANVTTRAGATS